MILIKNIKVYAPNYLGLKDVLLAGNKIEAIKDEINLNTSELDITVIDGKDRIITPGFIDPHVHLLGGGGEGGYHTRTPEVMFSELVTAGVTTVGGLLGTDGETRSMMSLLAKARGLEEEGVSTFIYSGSYRIPITTITGDAMRDILAIDKVIGVGEIAISDHRSSQPDFQEFIKLAADARVGGMLSGKAGVVQLHLGDGSRKLDLLFEALQKTEIPITQFYPTHMSRNPDLLLEGIKFSKMGGTIDLTAMSNPEYWETNYGEIRVSTSYKQCIESGVPEDKITISSDGHGSLPMFNERGEYLGMDVASLNTPFEEVKHIVQSVGIPFETAIKTITSNVADILKLSGKGRLIEGNDGDVCILDEKSLELLTVIAKGTILMEEGKLLKKGTFEKL